MCPLADYCPVISPLAGASLSGYCGSNYRDYYWCTMICAAPNIMAYGNNYVTVRCVARARVCAHTCGCLGVGMPLCVPLSPLRCVLQCFAGQWTGQLARCFTPCTTLTFPENSDTCFKRMVNENFTTGTSNLNNWQITPQVPAVVAPNYFNITGSAFSCFCKWSPMRM